MEVNLYLFWPSVSRGTVTGYERNVRGSINGRGTECVSYRHPSPALRSIHLRRRQAELNVHSAIRLHDVILYEVQGQIYLVSHHRVMWQHQ